MADSSSTSPAEKPVAIVSGAGSGIGAATAAVLAERGMIVVLVGRRETKLVETATLIESAGGETMIVPADLAEAKAPGEVVNQVLARYGRLDVLINNAAGLVAKPFDQFTLAEFDEQLATNVRSVFFMIQAALPALRRSPAPAIVNVSSSVGSWVRVDNALYSLTKAAVEHLTRCLAAELAKDNIRVNAIAPGPAATSILATLGDDIGQVHEELLSTVPLGRMGQPSELAWWIAQLVDSHAAWVTGAILPIDGGQTLGVGRRR
ncbi:MAG TPA: SDR family oxidoreductase [Ktedonobacteraceae bacterium]|nr:SDR family oxidoreductase [Ktedonobacteraceae bacterium]